MFKRFLTWLGFNAEPHVLRPYIRPDKDTDDKIMGIPLDMWDFVESYKTAQQILGRDIQVKCIFNDDDYPDHIQILYYYTENHKRGDLVGAITFLFNIQESARTYCCHLFARSDKFDYDAIERYLKTSSICYSAEYDRKGLYDFMVDIITVQQLAEIITVFDKYLT